MNKRNTLNNINMNKEEKEKIEVVKQMIADGHISREVAEIYFPELKESGDEKIRKFLIKCVEQPMGTDFLGDIKKEDVLAWLEKQGNIDLEFFENGENEKREFVGYGFLKCKGDFLSFKEGETYWLEYMGRDNYNVRSDNLLGQTFHITPQQLYTVFRPTTWLEKQGTSYTKKEVDDAYLKGVCDAKQELEKQVDTNVFDVPKIPIKDAVEVTSRMQYIDGDMKPIAEFIMDYAYWDLHKDEWNQPTLTVPLFRILDALVQRGKPYCECSQNIEKQSEQKPDYCHHKVDLSNCSEEYRKAYYDGWNNCNMQHSQCKSESNDVVKCLINGMKFYYEDNDEWGTDKFSMKVKDILSWLEKQREQKPVISADALREGIAHFGITQHQIDNWLKKYVDVKKQCEQKSFDYENANIQQKDFAPKVEPRFHEGDWLVQENIGVYKVIEICESWYEVIDAEDNHYSISFDKEYMCHSWDINKDAKDGDVLVNGSNIFKFHFIIGTRVRGYCHVNTDDGRFYNDIGNTECFGLIDAVFTPATKEQRDLLFQKKMKEARYEWDAEKKELKKIELKFKVGDWIVYDGWTTQILQVCQDGYVNNRQGFIPKEREDAMRLWDISDAKDGDILCTYECDEPKIVFILKGTPKKHYALSYHCYYNIMYPHFESASVKGCLAPNDEDVKPATKEQRDLLFQKMHEAGYEWDDGKKELKKIEKKSAWGEEDENIINKILCICNDFKRSFEISPASTKVVQKDINKIDCWLKSLKDRYTWKPSDEQIEILNVAKDRNDKIGFVLGELYKQLKALKGE